MKQTPFKTLLARVTPELHEELKQVAKAKNISVSSLTELWMSEALKAHWKKELKEAKLKPDKQFLLEQAGKIEMIRPGLYRTVKPMTDEDLQEYLEYAKLSDEEK